MLRMQSTSLLSHLRLIFGLKAKIPAPLALGMRMCIYFNPGREENMVTKIDPSLGEDLFIFFWSSPNLGQKNDPNLSEDLILSAFFLFLPNFGHKTVPIPNENRFSLVLHLRNSLPPLRIPG